MSGGGVRILASALAILLAVGTPAAASPLSSPWVEAHGGKARLIAGTAESAGTPRLWAGLEVRLSPGWKTYWRSPGDSGGLPPQFDWSRSVNLASVKVFYPAPRRFKDALGDAVGYSGSVVFPVEIRPEDATKPVELNLSLLYGICREICVPAEAELSLPIPAAVTVPVSPEIAAAIGAVPRTSDERRPNDPELISKEALLDSEEPKLVLEATFPGAAETADMFIETTDGAYVPLPVKTAMEGNRVRFEVDLTQEAEADELRGKTLRITTVSEAGQSETSWTIE